LREGCAVEGSMTWYQYPWMKRHGESAPGSAHRFPRTAPALL
jgi:hypothetical protein